MGVPGLWMVIPSYAFTGSRVTVTPVPPMALTQATLFHLAPYSTFLKVSSARSE